MIKKLDYFLNMAEMEGITSVTSTRKTRINALINNFISLYQKNYDINDTNIQKYLFEKYNLVDLSIEEKSYIAQTVQKKL